MICKLKCLRGGMRIQVYRWEGR